MSAEAKVNLAFDQIINSYPFDGSRLEVEKFFENLTGFDAWLFDQFPKFRGQLHFSGTLVGEDTDGTLGNWIRIKDHAGALFPELSKNPTGDSVLTPNDGVSMTIETQILLPTTATIGYQTVFQKMSGSTMGFAMYLEPTGSSEAVEAKFVVISGSKTMTTSTELRKGAFEHIAVTLNRGEGVDYLTFYKNGEIVNSSRNRYVINNMPLDASDFLIGSGTTLTLPSLVVTPTQTFSGTLDEFRLFHEARTTNQLQEYSRKALFSTDELKLYLRFNEPPPPLVADSSSAINSIVLDSSGNSLHSLIANFTGTLRQDASADVLSRMSFEKAQTAPVLFTSHDDVIALNVDMMSSASLYDKANPNLITRLVPRHYLEEGQALEGFATAEGGTSDLYGGDGIPGQGQKSSVQLFLSFLYIYARFFDELKLFVDAFKNLRYVDYETADTIPNNFLLDIAEEFGFNLPPLFNDSTIDQYVHAENIDRDISTSELPLRFVQNELLRRVLINMPDVLRSKGTQHSIKAFLRAIGIDPENSMRIREFGGPTKRQLTFARESKREPNVMANFVTQSFATTPYLSASRIEVGFPEPAGQFVLQKEITPHGISDDPNDGLLTSGSWTVESIVKWTPVQVRSMTSATQSLGRLMVTGSNDSEGGIIANFLAISSSFNPKLALYVRSGKSPQSPTLFLDLPLPVQDGLFNGDRWNVSFGCERNDAIGSRVSSSYFIRAARQAEGKVEYCKSTSSYFYESNNFYSGTFSGSFSGSLLSGAFSGSIDFFPGVTTLSGTIIDGFLTTSDGQFVDIAVTSPLLFTGTIVTASNVTSGSATGSIIVDAIFEGGFVAPDVNAFRQLDTVTNASGAFFAIGEGQEILSGTSISGTFSYLNDTLAVDPEARVTAFTGKVSNLRFWSKALELQEWKEHVRNYKSRGVQDPLTNWNYATTPTGSFERLRMEVITKQDTRQATQTGSVGQLVFLDFSENNLHLTGSDFPLGVDVLAGEVFDYSYLSPVFDEASTNEKIRARGYLTQDLVDETPWAQVAPVYEIVKSEEPTDDVRFVIEFSLVDALNRDIVTIFSTFDALENAIGNPELVFSPDYPDLDRMREVYFNRVKQKLNFKAFFEFFRWFDTTIGTFIEQLIPRKTNFKGTNFVVESHMLERHKLEYFGSEIYLGEPDRDRINDVILLQQFVGQIRKY